MNDGVWFWVFAVLWWLFAAPALAFGIMWLANWLAERTKKKK